MTVGGYSQPWRLLTMATLLETRKTPKTQVGWHIKGYKVWEFRDAGSCS